ncbi:hypothetical protein VITU102760_25605 [Vibrio tubiashii]|uniref:Uncharacterized protein n=1 Tax=Vibrio tubiashii ATCC 19109 TaxID=1051646 RepID=F9TDX5_9VIBR|nr:hypothetical protein [Vibrio tubiashii]AIW13573.1 hypothetical protein IX91_05060 [Vibrio tubiashii ATCC 19109]EGU46488.1 hypothetical protein VITU9109_21014 [Vibrio tubiashii ATCC 19109]EIF03218.1 hypothetical protein VT1337_14647 [Vibrio tubiashii NCIMB 1337 = ATCC 19106]
MNEYQIFHRSVHYQKNNRVIQANKVRMMEIQPDLVVDFCQCPRLFFAEKYADILSAMEPVGVERLKNPYRPALDADVQIDIGTEQELETIDDVDYVFFHVFNRYDVLDKDATQWNCDIPSIGAVAVPILDENKLNAIPLQQRLLFKLEQDPSFMFVHDSVVDAMLNAKMQDIWVRWAE